MSHEMEVHVYSLVRMYVYVPVGTPVLSLFSAAEDKAVLGVRPYLRIGFLPYAGLRPRQKSCHLQQ
jgi:hypothetical protein